MRNMESVLNKFVDSSEENLIFTISVMTSKMLKLLYSEELISMETKVYNSTDIAVILTTSEILTKN